MTGREGDDYLGKVKVKVGPVTSEFKGKAAFVVRDPKEHRAVIDARGRTRAVPATRPRRSSPSCTRWATAPASPWTPT